MQKFIAIKDVYAREILDSRGNPTIEVEVLAEGDIVGRAAVPSGASTGQFEAVELRDQERRYNGLGVRRAAEHVNTILADCVIGDNVLEQRKIDEKLCHIDGTENKENLGANAILGISMAVAQTAAKALHLPLYQYLGGTFAHQMPGANDEYFKWRTPCIQYRRSPGIYDHAVWGREFFKRTSDVCRDLPHTEKDSGCSGVINRSWRRGRICPEPEKFRRSSGCHCGSGREEWLSDEKRYYDRTGCGG